MAQTQSPMPPANQSQSYANHQQAQYGQSSTVVSNGSNLPWGAPFPSLHLWPIQETFAMKMLYLPDGQRIKIGRQTNQKTVPGERNAYFDSKVLSRTHAEVWEQGGKIYIRDVKSSNGTFINGERLSVEGVESDPFELKTDDIVEFGIDIVSEDNRTIVHHKVAAKVYCCFGAEDAALSAREVAHYRDNDQRAGRRSNAAASATGPGANSVANTGPTVLSSGGKTNGLSFDHVLHKLQMELARSKETGAELQTLATTMTDIQDTLGGGMPPSLNGSVNDFIPPQYRSASAETQAALAGPHGQQAAAFISLQGQLNETQTSLNGQLGKIRLFEEQLREYHAFKRDIVAMREQMEDSKRGMDLFTISAQGRRSARVNEDDDDDDARSVMTMMDNEVSEHRVRDRRRAERSDAPKALRGESSRPQTPEPSLNGDDNEQNFRFSSGHQEVALENSQMAARIRSLSIEVTEALQSSKTIQNQHSETMAAVHALKVRIGVLEHGVETRVADEMIRAEQRWEIWRVKFEEGWRKDKEGWQAERERLRGVVREWEETSRRGHEEEEERELNERMSGEEFADDGDIDAGDPEDASESLGLGEEWKGGDTIDVNVDGGVQPLSPSRSSKTRRRRPSHRTTLAVRALKAVYEETGVSTPKADVPLLEDQPSLDPRGKVRTNHGLRLRSVGKRKGLLKTHHVRTGSASAFKIEKESSESGKESGDTLKEGDPAERTTRALTGKKEQQHRPPAPGPAISILAVIAVAAVAGALYYRHKG